MKKVIEKFDIFEERLLVASLAFNVLVVFFQIIMRSIFNMSISWSEELSRYIFIWQTWLGVSIAYRYNEHIRVDMIYNFFKSEKSKKSINAIVDLIWLGMNLFLLYQGVKLLGSMNARNALSSGMRLPLVYIYAALPISSLLLSMRIIVNFFYKNDENNIAKSEVEV